MPLETLGEFAVSELDKRSSNRYTIIFIIILSFICALILSVLASALDKPKEVAKELDRYKEMMIATRVFTHGGYFEIPNEKGEYVPAKAESDGTLVPTNDIIVSTREQIIKVFDKRFKPFLVDDKGDRHTFEELKINPDQYIAENKKKGFYLQPYKLVFEFLPNSKADEKDVKPEGYVIPVNGFGLWDAIYGFLAIKPDGNTVIGISWYDQKETPGLGANIAETPWQSLFPGKQIFQPSPDGTTDFKSAPVGIIVVRGKVNEVLGNSPKAKSAVDGMAGATLTGNGVTKAYQDVLSAYRPFLVKLHEQYEKDNKK